MKLTDHIDFGGTEISNGNRLRAYLNYGLLPIPVSLAGCGCDTIGDTADYISPAHDLAPWFDAARPESEEFLGLLAYDARLDSVATRSVSPRAGMGATIGRRFFRHRILSIHGATFARNAQGQAYGEAWLRDVLAGSGSGCAAETVRVLLSCPPADTTADAQYRTLRHVGIVDGPNFGAVATIGECYIQDVQFQVAAGIPWLLSDEISCLPETSVVGS